MEQKDDVGMTDADKAAAYDAIRKVVWANAPFSKENRPSVLNGLLRILRDYKRVKKDNAELLAKLRQDREIKETFSDYKIVMGLGSDDRRRLLDDLKKLSTGITGVFDLD